MKAIVMTQPGGPDVLHLQEMNDPVAGDGQILIKVVAAGVNRPDILQRQGSYPPPAGAPLTLGLEVAGHVVGLGAGVQRYKLGDAVCALVPGGGYAELCVVAEANALPVPAGLSMVEAAALPETYFTVWTNVFGRGQLKAGETLLIHGGGSGIGTTAIQLAKAFGARVVVTAGSAEKCAQSIALGADFAINYSQEDFVEVCRSQNLAPNLILDMVGGDYIERNIRCAAQSGRIVSIAFLRGSKVMVDFMPMMLKRLTLTGSTLRIRSVAEKAEIAQVLEAQVWPLLASGKIKPQIAQSFRLEQAAEAHRLLESGQIFGKIVLNV